MKSREIEKIYNDTMKEYNRISQFNRLTSLTYYLALTSVEKKTDGNIMQVYFEKESKTNMSYSAADVKIEGVELIRGWIGLEEYAQKTGLAIENIQEKADKGELGRVEIKKGKKVVFWPPNEQGNMDLPPVDSNNDYMVKTAIEATVVREEELGLEEIISYLGTPKTVEKQTSEASLLLNRETFILYWSAFEQYIKNITFSLFELFPEQVFKNKKYAKNQMSYLDIFEGSSKFTNIQNLKENIIYNILGEPGTEREAISKQIAFVQDCFLEKSKNPYDTWYVIRGDHKEINYQVLDQIRIIRNALVHKTGEMDKDWDKIDLISKPEDNRIVIDRDLLLKTEMILKAVSFNLFHLISKSKLDEEGKR